MGGLTVRSWCFTVTGIFWPSADHIMSRNLKWSVLGFYAGQGPIFSAVSVALPGMSPEMASSEGPSSRISSAVVPTLFWHQVWISWKTAFPWTTGEGMVSEWFRHITLAVHCISNLMPRQIWQEILLCSLEFRDLWSIGYHGSNGLVWANVDLVCIGYIWWQGYSDNPWAAE